jgi:alkylation response protein AidB-like acyl-CoA dehydrogenase
VSEPQPSVDLRYRGLDADRAELAALAAAVVTDQPDGSAVGADLGWNGVGVAEDRGGSGGTAADVAVIAEAAGAALAGTMAPWVAGVVAPVLAAGAGGDAVRAITAGAMVALPIGSPWKVAGRLADPDGALRGTFLGLGDPTSEYVAVPVSRGSADTVLLVATSHPQVTAERVGGIDTTRRYTRFTLHGVPITDAAASAEGPGLLAEWLARACAVAALDAVGTARVAFARTLDYSRQRIQFGRPIGSFQAYKHRCATAFIELTMAQSLAFRAARELDEGARVAALSAGLAATAAATFIAGEAVQLHGGVGFTWEAGLHAHLKRTRADEIIATAGGATARQLLRDTAPSA